MKSFNSSFFLLILAMGYFGLGKNTASASSSGPEPGHTGAPGELTCTACHTPPGTQAGSVSLTGVPVFYTPGTSYGLTVAVNASGSRFGFELTAIDDMGRNAGTLATTANTQSKSTNILGNSRTYIEQNFASSSGSSWTFNWMAPASPVGPVTFYVSGLRGNNDFNQTIGDTTYNTNKGAAPPSPTITNQPASRTVLAGSNVLFTVGASGSATLRYQWRTNAINIANATNTTYTVTNAQSTNAGNYTVVVTNSFGSVTSSVATLTVNVPPSITNQPASQSVLLGNSATFTVGASGSATLRYQWRTNTINIANATNSSYTVTNAQSTNAANYTVVVTNSFGSITSSVATLTVNFAPSITTQPESQTVPIGSNVTLTATATGNPSPFYQWRTNGVNLSNKTNSTVTVTNFQSAQQTGYDVVVTNSVGAVTSATAVLYLNSPLRFTNLTQQLNVNFTALLIGKANSNYVIESASLLTNWTPVRTSSSPRGLINFTNTNVINAGRFYRARTQ
jgi:hypothetical protein